MPGWRLKTVPWVHPTADKRPSEAASRSELKESCRRERLRGHQLLEPGPEEDDPHPDAQHGNADLVRLLGHKHVLVSNRSDVGSRPDQMIIVRRSSPTGLAGKPAARPIGSHSA